MGTLLDKLGPRQRKGSKPRCHWLTHGDPARVAARLTALLEPWGRVDAHDSWMPKGFSETDEAQLHRASRLIPQDIGRQLRDWWLAEASPRSSTPNLDIASTCHVTVEGTTKPGLMLVEAKAHNEELAKEEKGKPLNAPISGGHLGDVAELYSPYGGSRSDVHEPTGQVYTCQRLLICGHPRSNANNLLGGDRVE